MESNISFISYVVQKEMFFLGLFYFYIDIDQTQDLAHTNVLPWSLSGKSLVFSTGPLGPRKKYSSSADD